MKTVFVGEGPRAVEVLEVLKTHPRTVVSGRVARAGGETTLPSHANLRSALAADSAGAIAFAGEFDAADLATARASRVPTFIADMASPSEATLRELATTSGTGNAGVFVGAGPAYSRARRALAAFLAGGRLGSIGHVSVEDTEAAAGAVTDGARHWLRRGGGLLAEVCGLLGTTALDVMGRIDEGNCVSEAYVATGRGVHVHYSARWNATADAHCTWLEGTGGSLRVDSRAVWWRKRGWRFFVPVHLGGVSRAAGLAASWSRVVAATEAKPSERDDRASLAIVSAVLISSSSRRAASVAGADGAPSARTAQGALR